MTINGSNYIQTRPSLITFLESQEFNPHPNEVFCPTSDHCWVDIAAKKGNDYWAFEYKSRTDSIRRGLEQCTCYAKAFNYVLLVAERKTNQQFSFWRIQATWLRNLETRPITIL